MNTLKSIKIVFLTALFFFSSCKSIISQKNTENKATSINFLQSPGEMIRGVNISHLRGDRSDVAILNSADYLRFFCNIVEKNESTSIYISVFAVGSTIVDLKFGVNVKGHSLLPLKEYGLFSASQVIVIEITLPVSHQVFSTNGVSNSSVAQKDITIDNLYFIVK